jgi:hypothetical protein
MKRIVCGLLLAVSLVGCVGDMDDETIYTVIEESASPDDDEVAEVRGRPGGGCCPLVMPNEPLGQICWLSQQVCNGNIPVICGYSCTEIVTLE